MVEGNSRDPRQPARHQVKVEPEAFEFDAPTLLEMADHIDIFSVEQEFIAKLKKIHRLQVEGLDRLPKHDPVVIIGNHCATLKMLGGTGLSEHYLVTRDVIERHVKIPVRSMAHLRFYDTPGKARLAKDLHLKLGLIPATLGNGTRVLEVGHSAFVFPEGRPSVPPYQLNPFYWTFAKMAWSAGVRICPTVFLGPHEAKLRYMKGGKQHYVDPSKRFPIRYKLKFLEPVDPREHLSDLDDTEALSAFCAELRDAMQKELDSESEGRPLVEVARKLQAKHGDAN